ncbi:peptidoglycan-binding domain-containing protein [Streptomyces sp. NBC_00459]|uniref:peptidoglycan-binding domain-containing protein n=1 Tax=Streptomyces sp. NBC_00459 TaxID=2975749 RepID=UPI002E16DF15
MRPNILTRSFISAATVAAIAGGSLLGTGVGFATAAPATAPAASAESVGILATQNFGLSSARAKRVQGWLATYWGYTDSIDGQLGTNSWKAFQRCLKEYWGYTDSIDGDPGPNTVKALQRLLRNYGYTGAIDGDPGSGTRTAFAAFADSR